MNSTEHEDDGLPLDGDTAFESEGDALDAFVTSPPAPVKRGLGWGVVLPLFLLAGAGGAIGGWALTQYVMPNYIPLPAAQAKVPKVDFGPLTARLDLAEKKLSAQSSQLSFLSSEIKSGAASVTVGGVDKALDITPLLNRLSELESRLDELPPQKMRPEAGAKDGLIPDEPISDESISSGGVDMSKPSLVAPGVTSKPSSETSLTSAYDYSGDIAALERRIDALEIDIEQTRSQALELAATPTIALKTVLLPRFPREALLDAMTAPRETSSGGWVSQTLKKHISVRNPQDVARAQATLERIESLAASRDYAAALALIEAMPSDVRSVAGEWTRAVKAEIKTP